MDVFEAIKGRRSVRAFKPAPLKDADLQKILEAAIASPSAGNRQPWEFVVVKDPETKQKLVQTARGQSFIAEAPVVVVVCTNAERSASRYGDRGATLYSIQDTAAAVQNIHLAAYALGYATCWIGAFDESAAAKVIRAPAGVRPVAMIPIGKANEKPNAPSRIPLEKVVHENGF